MNKLTVELNVKHLHLDNPFSTCARTVLKDYEQPFDPGIGLMIVNPTIDVAFFRVR